MRAGVHDCVGFVTVRQIDMRAGIPESELQNTHSWHFEGAAQVINFRRYRAEIFGNERKSSESIAKRMEEIVLRTFYPATVDGGFLVRGNLPICFEAAKVVKTNDVAGL